MSNLTLKSAEHNDVGFILNIQRLDGVQDFVTATSEEAVLQGLADPAQAYFIGLNGSRDPVAFAQLCGLKSPHNSIELRQLAAAVANKGYGGALLRLVISESFETLGANRLWLDVFPDNTRARKVYRELGFVEEGILRDAYCWHGTYRSAMIMSMLASEYRADSVW